MIGKLKKKFVLLSMSSLLCLLLVIVAGMNIINYRSVIADADDVLEFLSNNNGKIPEDKSTKIKDKLPPGMSAELPYEERFFSVVINNDETVIYTDISKIEYVDEEMAGDYARKVLEKRNTKGFISNFRYVVYQDFGNTRITFLDCGRVLGSFKTFFTISIGMSLLGFIIVFFVIVFFSGKIIRPISESYEKQKRFITDAGHEIKTPLTIINANVDLLVLEMGENESLHDIQQQTKRLARLTNDLVYLSRMEEMQTSSCKIDFPVSELVLDTVMAFKPLAQTKNKEFAWNIEPMLSLNGDAKAIEQLVSILLDNALKYSNENGLISISLRQQAKMLQLSVFNTTDCEFTQESIKRVFDRFYRNDESRNSGTGGHGIGLSIAKAIVNAHGGKIWAEAKEKNCFMINVIIPSQSNITNKKGKEFYNEIK